MPNIGSLGNVISRLGGLKNVSPRKVMDTTEKLPYEDELPVDISGAASGVSALSNLKQPQNLPESDFGGELTPQSYDVRANSVNPEQNDSIFKRFGQALADYVNPQKKEEIAMQQKGIQNRMPSVSQTPPVETAQVDSQEGLPPVTASEQESGQTKGLWQQMTTPYNPFNPMIENYAENVKTHGLNPFNPLVEKAFEGVKDYVKKEASVDDEFYAKNTNVKKPQSYLDKQNNYHAEHAEKVRQAMENPMQFSAYGSAEEVANHPALQAEFKQVTGIDYEPQLQHQISEYESAMEGVEAALNGENVQLDERSEVIMQRILNNQTNDMDKYFIGLSLLMPLIVGGFFGKQAGLGALGGAAQGIADVYGNRQKNMRSDEESLLDINKQKSQNLEKLAGMKLERTKLEPTLRKNLPEQPNKHLQGVRMKEWVDPETQEVKKGYEMKPGLVLEPQYAENERRFNEMGKITQELVEEKNSVQKINNLTSEIIEIANQLQTEGEKSAFTKGLIEIFENKSPSSISQLTQNVMLNGKKVNSGLALKQRLAALVREYGENKKSGQNTALLRHSQSMFDNPATTFTSAENSIDQMATVRDAAQQGYLENAVNNGFYPEFIISELQKENKKLYSKMNKFEEKKEVNELKNKLYK